MDLERRISQLSPKKLVLLEQKLKKRGLESPAATTAGRRSPYAPLSFAQERLWFLQQMEPESCLYNLPTFFQLRGTTNPHLVERALKEIVARHSALRTRFVNKDDAPCQVIDDRLTDALDFTTLDFRLKSAHVNSRPLSERLNDEIWVPFDLAAGPLLRARLILLPGDQGLLLVVMHHIIADGWSLNLFIKEFQAIYSSGSSARLAPVGLQYVDYAISQRQSLAGDKLTTLLSYWRARLDGAPSVMELPFDRPRPARQSFKGALYEFKVGPSSLKNLKSLCRECGVVPFMVLLSVFKVLLFRYTNQPKIVVGTPIANRNQSGLETVIGFFVNTLVLCTSIAPHMTFRQLLAQVRETTLGAYDHQDLPFEKLVSELQPERSLSHNPLFQVMFIYQNLPLERTPADAVRAADWPGEPLRIDVRSSKFDLTLAMAEADDGLSAAIEYATDLFEAQTIERMAGHFANILEHLLRNPDDEISGFCFLTEGERELILERWNDTGRVWPESHPLHGRFERRARESPDSTALIFRDESFSYRMLDRRANVVAQLLRREGVGRGGIVAVCLPRCMEMVVGLLATLKAGAAYMPIEPDLPEGRIAYILEDAKVTHVVTVSSCIGRLAAHQVRTIALDDVDYDAVDDDSTPAATAGPADLAYIIYTSGSTGEPKGVMVSHGAIDNRLQWMQDEYGLTDDDRVMQKTPYTFDVSVWEFFWTLSEGACLVIAEPERHKESDYLVDLIRRQRVTCLHFVPSMLQLFLHEDLSECTSLRRIICSGEALSVEQCRRLKALPGVEAHNLYGPTEAAVDVTHWDCREWRDQYLSVPIGRPITNTQIYILNDRLKPAPIGAPGELYIGGVNLADGYLNKPAFTAKQFIPNPFCRTPGARLYRTGDLARFRSDGNIEYIGRIDSQVKLRGLRIELGEIEFQLRRYPGISEVVVLVNRFGDHDERLVAYLVPDDAEAPVDSGSVAAYLGKHLPNYMVPSVIMSIPRLPLTPNGKLDRRSLPKPTIVRAARPTAPANDVEQELIGIWRRFLKAEGVGPHDDFFASGGHSILAIQVLNSINSHFNLTIPIRTFFENPTVSSFARAISELEDEVWLEESRTAAMAFKHSDFGLLQSVDEASEERIDEFLKRHLNDDAMTRFDDVQSLIAWSRSSVNRGRTRLAEARNADTPSASRGPEALGDTFYRHYGELARIRSELERIALSHFGQQARASTPDEAADVAKLRESAGLVLDAYAGEFAQFAARNGGGAISPIDLSAYCSGLMILANFVSDINQTAIF